jgi:chitodextrinase
MVLLQWSGATDNVGIAGYDIYQGGVIVGSVNGTTNFYEARNLVALSVYNFYVKARDLAGNESVQSNQVTATARNSGLFYKYYHHNGISSTLEIPGAGTITKVGFVTTPSVSPRTQTDNYAFVYEGFINLPVSANYRFALQTDEGSRMWVNNTLVVSHDGTHTCTKITSGDINFASGWYPVRIEYFENTNSECLNVRWSYPGRSEQNIPSSAFVESLPSQPSITAPNTFIPTVTVFNRVTMTWADRSNNETGFEISRSLTGVTGSFQVVGTTAANTTTYSDNTVLPSTRYYYQLRAINATNISSLVNLNPTSVVTPAAPLPPAVPANLAATAVSATQVNLTWSNVTGETGFELQKSSTSTAGFVTIANLAADVLTFSDVTVTGHSTVYYQIRSIGAGGAPSAWSSFVSVTTPNRAPVFTDIPSQTLLQNSAIPQTITITVTDPDADPISFQFTGLPNTVVFNSNGYGIGTLTFTNVAPGSYPVIAEATDGIATITDNFTLTVSANSAPVISTLSIDGVGVTPTPITAVQNQSAEAGRRLRMVFGITDTQGVGTLLSPVLTNHPSFASGSWASATGIYTLDFNTNINSVGIYDNITITFRDNAGGLNTQTFSLIVNPVDQNFKIYLNFVIDPTTDNEVAPWNNTIVQPSSATDMVNLKDELGNNLKYIRFNIPGTWDAPPVPANRVLPVDPNAVYTKKVRESFYNRGTGGGGNDSKTFIFRNLNPALQYRVTGYAAIPGTVGSTRFTRFIVAGASSQTLPDLNAINNTSETRTSDYRFPNSNGELTVTVRGPVPVVPNSRFYVNALVLEANYFAPTPPNPPSEVVLEATAHNNVNVSWTDNSLNETGFRIYRATSANGEYTQVGSVLTNISTFSDNTTEGRTTYYYKVSAYNINGESPLTPFAIITTPNGVPVLTNPGTTVMTAGQVLQLNLSATDPENDPMVLTVSGLPSFATLVDNGNGTGFIRFAPALSDVGPYQLTVNVVDNFSASADATFSLVVSDPEVAETFYVNLTATTAGNALAPWSNISSAALPAALVNSSGISGAASITRAGTWGASSDVIGVSTGSNSGLYADKVIQSGWVSPQTESGTTRITLNNLDNTKLYNITILGSRDEFWFANTRYSITAGTANGNGSTGERTLNTRKNTRGVVRFNGIIPSGNTITISVWKDPTVENTDPVTIIHRDATINAMVIEAYDLSVPRKPTNLVARGLTKTSIRLNWFDNSTNETGFEIQRADDPEGLFTTIHTTAANVESWDNTGLPLNTAYVYRVRAVKSTAPTAESSWSNTAMASSYSQIIQVNVNGAAGVGALQETSGTWYNLNTETSDLRNEGFTWVNLTDNTSIVTPVDLHAFNYTGGTSRTRGYSATGDVYPYEVMMSNYLYNTANSSEWILRELEPNSTFDLVFLGNEWEGDPFSRSKNGEKVVTDFIVGSDKQSIYNPKNNTERAFFYDVRPEADSTIYFRVEATVSTSEIITAGFFNAFEVRSYTPLEAAFDKIAPSVPQNLVASNVATDSVRLSWIASTDNIRVAAYEIYQGTNLVDIVTDTTFRVTGLQPSTNYTFSVRARDVKGNYSGFSTPVQITTLNVVAQLYYPKSEGDLHVLATWGPNSNGNGTSPSSFSNPNQHFILNRTAPVSSAMNLSAFNTKMIVTNGATLTVNEPITGQVDVNAGCTLVVNTETPPSLGTLAATSTVTFNSNPNVVPGANYGNLNLNGNASTKTFNTGTYTVNGNLSVANDVVLNGGTDNGTQLNLGGNLSLSGPITLPADEQLMAINFVGGGSKTLAIPSESDFKAYHIKVSNNTNLTVNGGTLARNITTGTSLGGGIVVEAGSTLNMGENNLILEGAGAVNPNNETGQIAISKGDITIHSTGAQVSNLYFVTGSDTVKSINLNANKQGQVIVGNKMHVSDQVDVQSGRLNANGNVVLVSSAAGTARINKIGIDGSVNGAVEFQRYMEPKRVYRYMGAPVYATRIVDWQATMPITGPFAGANTNASAASLFYWDESQNGWVAYPGVGGSNAAPIDVGRGYSLFQFNGTTPSKLQITGAIQQGNYDYTNLASGVSPTSDNGWNLLSNVYAAPIDWGNTNGWVMNNISGTVWIRNNSGSGVYKFMVYNAASGGDLEEFDGVIAQGQAFWVKATGPSPAIRITEDAKFNTSQTSFFRTAGPVNQLKLTLRRGDLVDKAFVHFSEESTDEIEGRFDAVKLDNSYFNISTLMQDEKLAINSMSVDFCEKRIPLNITNATAGTYTLTATNLNTFNFDVQMMLLDKFTNTSLTLSEAMSYSFDVTSDPLTQGKDRFELVISKPALQTNVTVSAQATEVCNDTQLVPVLLSSTQKGAVYSFYFNNNLIGTATGDGFAMQTNLQASALVAGNNLVEVRGGYSGCSEIVLPTNLQVKKSASQVPVVNSTAVCEGESVTITATGLQGEGVYKWYESMSATEPLQSSASSSFTTPALKKASTYYVSIQSGTCESTRTAVAVSVDVLMKPTVEQVINMLISSSNEGNQWYRNGVLIPGANSPTYEPTESGDYFVQVQSGVCVKNSETIQFVITGLDKESNHGFTIYPNPAHRKLNVLLPKHPQTQGYVTIAIFNTVGQLVWEQKTHSTERSVEIDVQKWVPGLYMVTFETEAGTLTSRFIKE